MKSKLFILAIVTGIASWGCSSSNKEKKEELKAFYGTEPKEDKAIDIDKAIALFTDSGQKNAVVKGEIKEACQSEGCWFSFKTKGTDLFVDFGEKFNVPKDIAGKKTVAIGSFYFDTTTIENLKEYAKEDGKNEAEINKIQNPEINIHFRATGVKIIK